MGQALGYMNFNQRYGFVHSGGGITAAHELGHGQGLSHTPETDEQNLMHPYDPYNGIKLRKSQWNALNK
jgi:hypothetical protein